MIVLKGRANCPASEICLLCGKADEDRDHMFNHCQFVPKMEIRKARHHSAVRLIMDAVLWGSHKRFYVQADLAGSPKTTRWLGWRQKTAHDHQRNTQTALVP